MAHLGVLGRYGPSPHAVYLFLKESVGRWLDLPYPAGVSGMFWRVQERGVEDPVLLCRFFITTMSSLEMAWSYRSNWVALQREELVQHNFFPHILVVLQDVFYVTMSLAIVSASLENPFFCWRTWWHFSCFYELLIFSEVHLYFFW